MVVKYQVFPVYPDDLAFPNVPDYPLDPDFSLIGCLCLKILTSMPSAPGKPIEPDFPAGPRSPIRPGFPGLPFCPSLPSLPGFPAGPGGPGGPRTYSTGLLSLTNTVSYCPSSGSFRTIVRVRMIGINLKLIGLKRS